MKYLLEFLSKDYVIVVLAIVVIAVCILASCTTIYVAQIASGATPGL